MILESKNRIKSIIGAVDTKTGHKNLNLKSAVQCLCDGYGGNASTSFVASSTTSGSVPLESGGNIRGILEAVNAKTGHNDTTITAAVQRLCDGYTEPEKLYSFGALSDLHIQYVTGVADLQRALTYLKDKVAFTCVAGDLVSYASAEHMAAYKSCVEGYAGTMPMYECAGNHETYPAQSVSGTVNSTLWTETTGKELYYTFTHGNDVFIMVSMKSESSSDPFPAGALDWLGTTLEANKNKRCFVFQHCPENADKTADPIGKYATILNGTPGKQFVNLMKQYPNVIWFHGHTHLTLGVDPYPVSDRDVLGYRSVHIPSLVSVRFYDPENTTTLPDYYYDENNVQIWGSLFAEGYIVDVYTNKIVLRGINFAAGTNRDQVQPFTNEIYALDTTF